jgi:hypothetical protein
VSRKDVGRTQRLVSDLLDREWDPIGVFRLPAADQPPGGEYDTYAGWVTGALYSGGGVEEIVRCLQRARDSMGLEAPPTLDEPVARLILERWQADA